MGFILCSTKGALSANPLFWEPSWPLISACLYSQPQYPQSQLGQELSLDKRKRFSQVALIRVEDCNPVVSSQLRHYLTLPMKFFQILFKQRALKAFDGGGQIKDIGYKQLSQAVSTKDVLNFFTPGCKIHFSGYFGVPSKNPLCESRLWEI